MTCNSSRFALDCVISQNDLHTMPNFKVNKWKHCNSLQDPGFHRLHTLGNSRISVQTEVYSSISSFTIKLLQKHSPLTHMLALFSKVPLPVVNILTQYELQSNNPTVSKAFIRDKYVDWNVWISAIDGSTIPFRTSLVACFYVQNNMKLSKDHTRCKVLTAVMIKIQVFWGIMPCQLVNSYDFHRNMPPPSTDSCNPLRNQAKCLRPRGSSLNALLKHLQLFTIEQGITFQKPWHLKKD